MSRVKLNVRLTDDEAWDLKQLLERLGFSDVRNCAVDVDETYRMLHIVKKLRRALSEAVIPH